MKNVTTRALGILAKRRGLSLMVFGEEMKLIRGEDPRGYFTNEEPLLITHSKREVQIFLKGYDVGKSAAAFQLVYGTPTSNERYSVNERGGIINVS